MTVESNGACAEEDMRSEKEEGKAGELLTQTEVKGCLWELDFNEVRFYLKCM